MIRRLHLGHPRSAPGAFYALRNREVPPAAQVPNLVVADDSGFYFARQPATSAEIDAVVAAVASSGGALRYAGHESFVLDALRHSGACDALKAPHLRDSWSTRAAAWVVRRIPAGWLRTFGRAVGQRLRAR